MNSFSHSSSFIEIGLRSLKLVEKSSAVLDIILLPYTNITIQLFTKMKTLKSVSSRKR